MILDLDFWLTSLQFLVDITFMRSSIKILLNSKMSNSNGTFEESSEISYDFVMYRISFVAIIFFIVITIFLVCIGFYNLCCSPDLSANNIPEMRSTWSTDRRSTNRKIRKKIRKPVVDSNDDVNTMSHSPKCEKSSNDFSNQLSKD